MLSGGVGKQTGEGPHYVVLLAPGSCISELSPDKFVEQSTSGSLAMIPGVRFEASERNCVENSESAPRAGCTDSTMSLVAYAILATVAPEINHLSIPQRAQRHNAWWGKEMHTCFTNSSYRSHDMDDYISYL